MAREQIWKYADKEQIREFILSLKLLPAKSRAQMSEEKQLSLLYALSNQAHRHYHMASLPKRDGGSRRRQRSRSGSGGRCPGSAGLRFLHRHSGCHRL